MCSSRTPALSSNKKRRWEEEEEDLTKDMEDPPSEQGVQEVLLSKQGERQVMMEMVKSYRCLDVCVCVCVCVRERVCVCVCVCVCACACV